MSKKKSQREDPRDEAPDVEQPQPDEQDTEQADPQQDATPDVLLARLQEERDELEQRLLRTAADYQNYVKRSHQNVASAREQQIMDIAKGLVTVLDHFDRAMDVDPEKASAVDVLAGVKIVREELITTLGRFGIQRVEAQPGEPFDPNRHEAMMRQPHDDLETDQIVQQFQPGYALGDKTIRAAQVSVAQ